MPVRHCSQSVQSRHREYMPDRRRSRPPLFRPPPRQPDVLNGRARRAAVMSMTAQVHRGLLTAADVTRLFNVLQEQDPSLRSLGREGPQSVVRNQLCYGLRTTRWPSNAETRMQIAPAAAWVNLDPARTARSLHP